MRKEAELWFKQALEDIDTAKIDLKHKKYYACSFWSQQASEKALKALYLELKREAIISHSLLFLAKSLQAPRDILDACAFLNPEYAVSRYPDAAAGIPSEVHTEHVSSLHLQKAEVILQWVTKKLPA